MTKNLILSLSAVCIASWTLLPVSADSTSTNTQAQKSQSGTLSRLPRAMAGFFAGVVVGTPVCFVRKLPEEINNGAHGLVGSIFKDNNNELLLVPAGILWSPVALIMTGMEAPGYALRDAYMSDRAFSPEQFSLGQLDSDKKK